jgi:hypothetical protein
LACDDQLVDGDPIANIKLGKNWVVIMKDGKGPPCDYAERSEFCGSPSPM